MSCVLEDSPSRAFYQKLGINSSTPLSSGYAFNEGLCNGSPLSLAPWHPPLLSPSCLQAAAQVLCFDAFAENTNIQTAAKVAV